MPLTRSDSRLRGFAPNFYRYESRRVLCRDWRLDCKNTSSFVYDHWGSMWEQSRTVSPESTDTFSEHVVTLPCTDFMKLPVVDSSFAWSFQRSPICTSYADWWHKTNCSIDDPVHFPPGVWNEHLWNSYECCGGCNILDPPHVRILYWPPDKTSECSSPGTSTQASEPYSALNSVERRNAATASQAARA